MDHGTALSCQCLLLSDEGLILEESGCKGFRHLNPSSLNQNVYYQVLNQAAQYNQHQQSLSNRTTISVQAPIKSN